MKRSCPCVDSRCRYPGGNRLRPSQERSSRDHHLLRKPTVEVDARHGQSLADHLSITQARRARSAADAGCHNDVITNLPGRICRLDDPSGDLVSERDRDKRWVRRTVQEMKVGAAHTAHLNGDDHVTGFHRAEVDFFGSEITRAVEPKGTHFHGFTIRVGSVAWRRSTLAHLKCFLLEAITTAGGIGKEAMGSER
jgi:hypothetical protein